MISDSRTFTIKILTSSLNMLSFHELRLCSFIDVRGSLGHAIALTVANIIFFAIDKRTVS